MGWIAATENLSRVNSVMHDPSRYHTQLWKLRRVQVLNRCGFRCVRCGKPGRLEVHHKTKIADGGSDDLENLEALCRKCHFRAHKRRIRDPEHAEWIDFIESRQ